MSGINIVNIGSAGETIEFTVLNLMLLGDFLGVSNDSDGDGILNPGETAILEFTMSNMSDDILAYAITGTLSSEHPITFSNPIIEFGDLAGSQSSFSNFVEIVLSDDIPLGDIPITLEINAEYIQGNDLLFYNDSYTFNLNVNLNQSGFPDEISFHISSSPIVLNVDGESHIDMPNLLEKQIEANEKVNIFPLHEYWLDIGQIEQLEQAKLDSENLFE